MIPGIEQKYRSILNNIEELYYEVDLAGNLTFSNDSMSKILGYSKDELIGINNRQYRVFTVTCKDGTEKIINFIPVQLETVENLMACEDITERKQAETALHKSEEKYRTILNSIEEGYYEVDLTGNFTFSNDFLAKSLGYTREELKGLNNRGYMSPEIAKLVFNTFNEVYRTGNPKRDFEWELINKDGTKRFVEVSVSLMRDGKGKPKGFYGIARDITERKHAEEQERNLQRARDKVLHHLSHELRTPLSIVQGNIRILKRKIQVQSPPIVRGEIFDSLERSLVRLFDGLFHTLDTELYRSKKPYDFGAGGKGLDLLRMKVYSKRFGFDISMASQRCLYLPTDRDLCPGRISKCPHCRVREDCFNSGGSTFSLTFTVGAGNRS
ncbi:MAG: hypothetical protein A2026_03740 [Deltaproteobacteria bacterium RBG_19FT_COMBO_46_12]|nr:MAG: hypothetical protein A2026_03740 [Deltaproteobacteria bacterium RBG_19FT_COMBO_46_12]